MLPRLPKARLVSALALAAVAVSSMACAQPRVSLAEGTREYVASDYPIVLKRWTRSESLLSLAELDDLLTATATFESWDFRWAYVVRYAQDYRLTVDQRRLLLERTLGETEQAHHFYLALYGSNRRSVDLSRHTSAWTVRLIDDQGNETAPSKVESIPKPTALEQTYFPYTTVWRVASRLTFPLASDDGRPTIAPDAKWFGLRFAGAEGNEELRWQLDSKENRRAAFGAAGIAAF